MKSRSRKWVAYYEDKGEEVSIEFEASSRRHAVIKAVGEGRKRGLRLLSSGNECTFPLLDEYVLESSDDIEAFLMLFDDRQEPVATIKNTFRENELCLEV